MKAKIVKLLLSQIVNNEYNKKDKRYYNDILN